MPEYPLKFDTGVMVFEVTISGHSRKIPLKMVCDTGATMMTIPWLDFELEKVEAICHNLPPQTTISGLLGLNVLRKFNIGFNFPKNTLTIIPAP